MPKDPTSTKPTRSAHYRALVAAHRDPAYRAEQLARMTPLGRSFTLRTAADYLRANAPASVAAILTLEEGANDIDAEDAAS